MPPKNGNKKGDDKEDKAPRSWWQWFLVYPGLLIAVIGAVPTYIEAIQSYSFGVPFGRSADARVQSRLWQENFDCTAKATFTPIVNRDQVSIASAVCESGDVLLAGKRPGLWRSPRFRTAHAANRARYSFGVR